MKRSLHLIFIITLLIVFSCGRKGYNSLKHYAKSEWEAKFSNITEHKSPIIVYSADSSIVLGGQKLDSYDSIFYGVFFIGKDTIESVNTMNPIPKARKIYANLLQSGVLGSLDREGLDKHFDDIVFVWMTTSGEILKTFHRVSKHQEEDVEEVTDTFAIVDDDY